MQFNDPATNDGLAGSMDRSRSYSLFVSGYLRDFSLPGALVSSNRYIPAASFGAILDAPRTKSTDRCSIPDLKKDKSFEGTTCRT
ncbi:MAG: hypothetical protein FPO08_12520 [Geobacter sp.]|nr:MAG: hypothetical protein FPO08_12520 [Geobacter sp.]